MLKFNQFSRILRSNQTLFFSTRRKNNEFKKDGKGKDGLRLFVSNIPQQANWKHLKDHFAESGAKFVSISADRVTNISKGCGLIKYDNIDEAQRAIHALNGSNLLGNILHVRADRKDNNKEHSKLGNYKGDYNNNKSTNHRSLRKFIQSNGSEISTLEAPESNNNDNSRKLDLPTTKQENSSVTIDKKVSNSTINQTVLADINHLLDGKEYTPPPVYTRSSHDITYLLRKDIKTIEELIEKRYKLLENGENNEAEDIHGQLQKEFEVSCDDEKKEWSVLTPIVVKQSNKRSNRNNKVSMKRDSYSSSLLNNDNTSSRRSDRDNNKQYSALMYRRDGRDSVYIPQTDYEAIKVLIQNRAECYMRGERERVEEYSAQLMEQYSVRCFDQNRSWSIRPNPATDSSSDSSSITSDSSSIDTNTNTNTIHTTTTTATSSTTATPTTATTTTNSFEQPYHRDIHDINFLPRNQVASVNALILERNKYLSTRNLTEAENIDQQLLLQYEVVCMDDTNTWTVQSPTINMNRRNNSSNNRSSRGRNRQR